MFKLLYLEISVDLLSFQGVLIDFGYYACVCLVLMLFECEINVLVLSEYLALSLLTGPTHRHFWSIHYLYSLLNPSYNYTFHSIKSQ